MDLAGRSADVFNGLLGLGFRGYGFLDEKVVLQAIADIENINGNAMKRVGLLVDDWSEERLKHEEQRLFIGFACRPDEPGERKHEPGLGFGDDLLTAGGAASASSDEFGETPGYGASEPASEAAASSKTKHPFYRDDNPDDLGLEIEDR